MQKRLPLIVLQKKTFKKHNPNWPQFPDHPYRILMIGGSGPEKTNLLLNLIRKQPDFYKIYLYAKDLNLKIWIVN